MPTRIMANIETKMINIDKMILAFLSLIIYLVLDKVGIYAVILMV